MEKVSIWKTSSSEHSFPTLNREITVDVAIVGGGITGISAAYLLSKARKKVAVLEAAKVANSSTGYSTGNLYATVGGEGMHMVKSKWNKDVLQQVFESRAAAVSFIADIVTTFEIECNFTRVPWCLFAEPGGNSKFVEEEKKAAEQGGLTVAEGVSFPAEIETGFTIAGQAQFNPLQYTTELANKIQSENCLIFENTKVTKVEEGDRCKLTTTGGTVTAAHVIMATHTPKGVYLVQTSLGPYREYAVAVKLNGNYPEPGIYWDMVGNEHYSMRTYDSPEGKVLMVLGEAHKVGQKENNDECFNKLETFIRSKFDVSLVVNKWAAQQYKPADGIPYIGTSSGTKQIYIATGFAADGLTYGTLAAMIISDQITGKENKWSKTYDASRLTPVASFTNFVKENANVAYELVKDYLSKDDVKRFDEINKGEGKIMEVDGKNCAVHRDESGNLHVVTAACTHLGCIVHWNHAEQSWDCPCHGSRFTVDGEVIEGPAIDALKKLKV